VRCTGHPHLAHLERAEHPVELADVVGVGVGEDHDVDAFDVPLAQQRYEVVPVVSCGVDQDRRVG
jgi:hypothetical protein